MGLLDNYTGIGTSPRPKWRHQMTMARAVRLMYDELAEQEMILTTEATVTDDWDDLAPDLVAFSTDFVPLLMIEITTHRELKQIIKKCYELIARFPEQSISYMTMRKTFSICMMANTTGGFRQTNTTFFPPI